MESYAKREHTLTAEEKFKTLVEAWKETRLGITTILDECTLPPYYQIIGMGEPAVTLILKEMQKEQDYWFWALNSITCENPVPEEDMGNLSKMTEHWIKWGQQEGYI